MLARRRELLNGVDLDERPAPEDGGAVRGALLDALAKLPDRQRRAYLLREVHGLRIAEIAAELSLAAPQVEQALFAARNRLAETLVFGGSLTCDAARRLLEGPLAAVERKALRHHFRTCDACRATGIRVAPGLVPLDWLRGRLVDLLVGGAAPAAAKVGAVVVASVATGAAVGPPSLAHEPHATGRRLVLAAAVPVPARRPAPVQVRHAPAARPVVLAGPAPRPTTRRGRRESEPRHEDAVRTTDRHGDSGRHGGGPRKRFRPPPLNVPTTARGRGRTAARTAARPSRPPRSPRSPRRRSPRPRPRPRRGTTAAPRDTAPRGTAPRAATARTGRRCRPPRPRTAARTAATRAATDPSG